MARQNAAHVVQTSLRGTVGESFERGDAEAVNGADVYDARGRGGGLGSFEEGRYGLGELEDAF